MLLLVFLSFTAVSYSASCLKFLVIGDWGGLPFFPYKTFVEMNVGRDMAVLSDKMKIDYVLALGDNFYLKGVTDVNDPRFKETFESAFNYSSLNIPWFVIAGNHDHYGNVSAQIMYSSRSERWNFPNFYYTKSFNLDDSTTLDLIMTDSIILCGNTLFDTYSQPVLHKSDIYRSEKHWKWLEESLKSSKANYLLVSGHFPVYSIGSHGSTKCLVDRLHPLLKKYNATAYLSGHDHNIQHIQVKESTSVMDYFVSGSACFIDPSRKHEEELPPNSLFFHWANPFSFGAFMYVEINPKNMTVAFFMNGKDIYSYSKQPRF